MNVNTFFFSCLSAEYAVHIQVSLTVSQRKNWIILGNLFFFFFLMQGSERKGCILKQKIQEAIFLLEVTSLTLAKLNMNVQNLANQKHLFCKLKEIYLYSKVQFLKASR